jgi:BirA family biotin operon repressor/biotin-[acetyl-CoA-carboxylase] ligase
MLFGLAASLGVAEALEEVGAPRSTVKWPNDIEIAGLKIAGILAEGRDVGSDDAAHVIGIGINVRQQPEDFPPELRARATSLRIATGEIVDRDVLLDALLRRIGPWLDLVREGRTAELDGPFARRDALAGSRVSLFAAGELVEGVVESISPRDGLALRLDSGTVRVVAPETASEIRRTDDGSVMSR